MIDLGDDHSDPGVGTGGEQGGDGAGGLGGPVVCSCGWETRYLQEA